MSFPLIASKKVSRFLVDSCTSFASFDDVVFFAPSLLWSLSFKLRKVAPDREIFVQIQFVSGSVVLVGPIGITRYPTTHSPTVPIPWKRERRQNVFRDKINFQKRSQKAGDNTLYCRSLLAGQSICVTQVVWYNTICSKKQSV